MSERCINALCPERKTCALFVKAPSKYETLIAGDFSSGDCDLYDELHKPWGYGPENFEND